MRRELGMLVALIVLCGVIWYSNGDFAKESNVSNIARQVAMLSILAIGASFVIVTGGIDLSAGAVVGLTGIIIAYYASPVSSRVDPNAQPPIVQYNQGAAPAALTVVSRTGYYALYPDKDTSPVDSAVYLYPGDRFGFQVQGGENSGVYRAIRPVRPKVAGTITKIVAKDHDILNRDDVIVETDNPELIRKIADTEAQVKQLEATVAKIPAGATDEKSVKLFQQYKDAGKALADLQDAQDALQIKAPFAGELIAPHLADLAGKYIKPGDEIAMLDEQHLLALSGPKYAWKSLGQLSFERAIVVALLVAMGIGLMQGLLITRLDLQPFIVTLASMLTIRGVCETITNSGNISFGSESPFLKLANLGYFVRNNFSLNETAWLPYVVAIALAVALGSVYLLHFTVFGRYLYAIGGNRDAATYSGIRVKQVEAISYVISAGLAGVAGVCWASYIGQMNHTVGTAYELTAIAACVLGGFSLRGGEGTILGVLIGAGVINIINNGLDMFQYVKSDQTIWRPKEQWRNIVMGEVIRLAVILDIVFHLVQKHRRTRSAGGAAKTPSGGARGASETPTPVSPTPGTIA